MYSTCTTTGMKRLHQSAGCGVVSMAAQYNTYGNQPCIDCLFGQPLIEMGITQ